MSDKRYITAQQLLEDSFRVAAQVYEDGFRPDFIIGIWRGGAPIGIAVQEYYDYKGIDTDHISDVLRHTMVSASSRKRSRYTACITLSKMPMPITPC